jgi:hypothetical protein
VHSLHTALVGVQLSSRTYTVHRTNTSLRSVANHVHHGQSGTGLLITQRIAFGSGGIEPLLPKCADHELANPLPYYRAIVSALARLAASHKAGLLSPEVDTYFPFDADRAAADPQLLQPHLASAEFIARLERDAVRFKRHEPAVKRFLQADRNFIAMCHYNANVDNAWFWRDHSGVLQCGFLDWGRVRLDRLLVSTSCQARPAPELTPRAAPPPAD